MPSKYIHINIYRYNVVHISAGCEGKQWESWILKWDCEHFPYHLRKTVCLLHITNIHSHTSVTAEAQELQWSAPRKRMAKKKPRRHRLGSKTYSRVWRKLSISRRFDQPGTPSCWRKLDKPRDPEIRCRGSRSWLHLSFVFQIDSFLIIHR